ncbi:Protein of unknown function [Myxococcus fulvus]|uniref:Lipoprotein n=1 Tax=Myxococcus fulvus TaxID=33 RepID=A0A511TFZ2_MYXFU|nr:DUF2845 domain-containing protein [Myxococcus fulvus]AKF84301.1 hypothetical protein MFUL124B02_41780 [Myxococcus fulvus 124B02]GEN13084.1 hypothetical protein MFU01_81210 [Myxococcus fulvus]SEU40956.1 Protein of unknown function [Myxococcus fulvus]
MRLVLAPLVLAGLLLPLHADAATLRCGNNLISDGATTTDAVIKCGEPLSKQRRTESTSTKERVREGKDESSTSKTVTVEVEEWTYNFGPNRLMQVVTFTDGKLTDVRSTVYGK